MPIVDPPPSPIDPPFFVGELYAGQTTIAASRAHFGALVTITVNGTPWPFEAMGDLTTAGLYPLSTPLGEGDEVTISQEFCEGDQPTRPTVVRSCDEMPAPQIQPPGIGDRHVDVLVSVPDTRIFVFANGIEIGDGGGRRVMLSRPIQAGETIMVVQETTAGCRSNEMHFTTPACVPRDRLADPTFAGRFDVGATSYDLHPVEIPGFGEVDVRATVRFPIDTAGGAGGLPTWGRPMPLVVIMHGNAHNLMDESGMCECIPPWDVDEHLANGAEPLEPAYLGYIGLMESLARAGIVSASIDASQLNCIPNEAFIDVGAELLLHHLGVWRGWADGSLDEDPLGGALVGRVDLQNVALVGHSRGGTRIPVAIAYNSDPDIVIRSAVLVAPPAIPGNLQHLDVPMLMIVGARDQDIASQPPWPFYDGAAGPLRSQMWLSGAGHYFFNSTAWGCDEVPVQIAPEEHAAFLEAYGRSFLEATLLDGGWTDALAALSGDGGFTHLPSYLANMSFSSIDDYVVDAFEELGLGVSSLGQPVSSSGFSALWETQIHETSISGSNYFQATSGAFGSWSSGSPELEEQLGGISVAGYRYVSFRAAQPVGEPSDYTFEIELDDGSAAATAGGSSVIAIQRAAQGSGIFWPRPALQGVRVPIACLAASVAGDIDIEGLQAIRLRPQDLAANQAAIAIDDIAFQR